MNTLHSLCTKMACCQHLKKQAISKENMMHVFTEEKTHCVNYEKCLNLTTKNTCMILKKIPVLLRIHYFYCLAWLHGMKKTLFFFLKLDMSPDDVDQQDRNHKIKHTSFFGFYICFNRKHMYFKSVNHSFKHYVIIHSGIKPQC